MSPSKKFGCLSAELEDQQEPVEKESPSRANNPLQGEGNYPSRAKLPTNAMRQARREVGADLSNLVLQSALSKWKINH